MRYVAEAKYADKAVRLVPFEYSDTDAYLLEFGGEYVRFYKDGAQLAEDGSPYELETPISKASFGRFRSRSRRTCFSSCIRTIRLWSWRGIPTRAGRLRSALFPAGRSAR